MDKHILYLSYDGMTDPLGQSQVLPYIIGLTKAGYSFHLVSFEKPDRYNQFSKSARTSMSENFDISVMRESLTKVYRSYALKR